MTTVWTLCKRENGKLTALAGTNAGDCQAGAETVFQREGYTLRPPYEVSWTPRLIKQRNFKGYSPTYRTVDCTEAEKDIFWCKRVMKESEWIYTTLDRFFETFDDLAIYRQELQSWWEAGKPMPTKINP